MALIQAYLGFNGNCKEAMQFYQSCFGGDLTIQTIAESAVAKELPAEVQSNVLHSFLQKDDFMLLGSDMAQNTIPSQTVSLMIQCTSLEEIQDYFAKLAAGGKITAPLNNSFWGSTFGHLTDKYSINWLLNYAPST
jgi:PhnB protein